MTVIFRSSELKQWIVVPNDSDSDADADCADADGKARASGRLATIDIKVR